MKRILSLNDAVDKDEPVEVVIVSFFFQAEDGIRDDLVTGVQTCALPICAARRRARSSRISYRHRGDVTLEELDVRLDQPAALRPLFQGGELGRPHRLAPERLADRLRSEERRVGKESGYRRTAGR